MDLVLTGFVIVAIATLIVAIAAFISDRGTPGHLSFCFGLVLLAFTTFCSGMAIYATDPGESWNWHVSRFVCGAALPPLWLTFSFRYARGSETRIRPKLLWSVSPMVAAPIVAVIFFEHSLMAEFLRTNGRYDFEIGWAGYVFYLCTLLSSGLLLVNLEHTFRAAVGTYRWRIKFIIIGVATIFTARVYTASQIILFKQHLPSFEIIHAASVLIGCCFILIGLMRRNIFRVEVYPSQQVLQYSLTTVLIGAYLLIIGIFSKVLGSWEGTDAFMFKAFVLVLSLAGLALFLLSERSRDNLRRFVSRHLNRPIYDYRAAWLTFSEQSASVVSADELSRKLVHWVAAQLHALSTSVWLTDSDTSTISLSASTAVASNSFHSLNPPKEVIDTLAKTPLPFDIDKINETWVDVLKPCFPKSFKKAGNRVCVPLIAAGQFVGFVAVCDRVNNVPLDQQEFDLLKCVADQVASNLLNLRLSNRLVQAKEMEAFQTIAAFFIHDLKNTASTLNLTLQNLPKHFDNPEFRKDALKAIGKSVAHIQELISRLTLFRQKLELTPRDVDLNKVIESTLGCIAAEIPVRTQFSSELPAIRADEDQLQKVFTNLLLNAREALKENGEITLSTSRQNGWAIASVSDNGCGMSAEFITHSLFRPFKTTKRGGIGIGMFQIKAIIEAHRGKIEVESEPGRGTTFRVYLPESNSSAHN